MTTDRSYFELHRRIDDLVYQFDQSVRPDGSKGYKRRDKDLWIVWSDDFGWVGIGVEPNPLGGRAWLVLPKDQKDYPPEGVWVSMKNEKSYVYDLVYPNNV